MPQCLAHNCMNQTGGIKYPYCICCLPHKNVEQLAVDLPTVEQLKAFFPEITKTAKEYTGSSVNYYRVEISKPVSGIQAYRAECNDIIEALGMNFAEGNAFKAIWRSCANRTLGLSKEGYKDGKYDAEKVVYFGKRMVEQAMNP